MPIKFEHIKTQKLIVNSHLEKRLLKVTKLTFSSNISLDSFRAMFKNCNFLDITFLRKNNVDVGFIYFATYEIFPCMIIIRPGVGLLPKHRINGLTSFKMSLAKSIFMLRFRNPRKHVYIISININPLMYSAICTYWSQTYPSPTSPTPDKYASILEVVKQHFGIKMNTKCVVDFPFTLLLDKKDTQRMNRDNPYIRFFFGQTYGIDATSTLSDVNWDKGLLTLTPVNVKNLINILLVRLKIKAR